jgi:hypothetical protein
VNLSCASYVTETEMFYIHTIPVLDLDFPKTHPGCAKLSATKTRKQGRVAVSLPQRMVEAIDDLVKKHSDLFLNRQQFVESALREKIEKLKWK